MLDMATSTAARYAVEPVTCNTVCWAEAEPMRVQASKPAKIVLDVFKVMKRAWVLPARLAPEELVHLLPNAGLIGATIFAAIKSRTTNVSLHLCHKQMPEPLRTSASDLVDYE